MVPWYTPWSDLLKKKVCRYLLQRYLGQFLEEKLRLEQLNVELYNGKGTVTNVSLYPEALNELCESQGWGIEVTGGHVGSVTVTIPWNALMTNDSHIEVSDLFITIRPRARQTDGTSMLESMWSSVSSSMQLAQECLQKEGVESNVDNAQNATIEGLEKFAQTIDNVLNRIKAKFIDTNIRLEYLPPKSDRGIAIIIKIRRLQYKNEAGADPPDVLLSDDVETSSEDAKNQKTHLISSYATHNITMEGITFYTEEFRIRKTKEKTDDFSTGTQFLSTISQLPETEQFIKSNSSESDSEGDADSRTESEKPETNAEIFRTKPIQFCSWDGIQEIRLKMKQADQVLGPKVYLDLSFGALQLFITPRQLHLLIAYCEAMSTGGHRKDLRQAMDKQIRSSKRLREMKRSSSMGHYNAMTGAIPNDGWSSASTEGQIQYQQQTTGYREHSKSFDITESLNSSMTSSTSTTNSSKFRKRGTNINLSGDISRYTLHMSSISLFLLHEDILVECTLGTDSPLSEESVDSLLDLSTCFFGNGFDAKSSLNSVCNKSHLKLQLCPIILDGEEQRSNNMQLLKLTVAVPRFDLCEILDKVEIPLIKFSKPEHIGTDVARRPEVRLAIKHITPTMRRTGSKRRIPAKTELQLVLEACAVELDISIYDRLNSLLNTAPFSTSSRQNKADMSSSNKSADFSTSTEISVEADTLRIRLRFPINDSRPLHDENRVPWWKKNVRDEFLLFNMQRFLMQYHFPSAFEMCANEIDIFYCENMNSSKVHIGKTTLIEKTGKRMSDASIEYPRIKIEFPSERTLRNIAKRIFEDSSDSGDTSGESYGATIYAAKKHERSPFSSKRVCRESGTPHHKENSDDSETFILPGDSEEMKRFCETSTRTSQVQVQVNLPVASIQINSKHLYEVIYNLLNTDLLMWKPVAPSFRNDEPAAFCSTMNSFLTAGMMDSIYIPSGGGGGDGDNDSDGNSKSSSSVEDGGESDGDSDTMYYSTYDRKHASKRSLSTITTPSPNAVSFELNVGQGVLTLFAPVRGADNNVIPGQLGEFALVINSLTLFSVSGFQENTNLSYVCLRANEAELRHCGLIPSPLPDPPLRLFNQILPDYLKSTLYPSPKNLTLRKGKGSLDREMISLAIQVKVVPEQRVKRICVTVGLQNTTLRHYPMLSQHSWLNQMIDMIDVVDYPIEGYVPYGVVTEMQLHLWDCCIDYRPLYFPYRAVLDLGYFMISSNLTTSLPGCTLRFIAEECALCLAPHDAKDDKKDVSNELLVSVVDAGLIEISLRINEKATQFYPKLDLRAFIQSVHIRTCSDSGQALSQLIGYFAADSDLNAIASVVEETNILPMEEDDAELLPMRKSSSSAPEVTPKQQERVNTLMAEAMQESVRIVSDSSDDENRLETGVEVFFFPDEAQKLKLAEENKESVEDVVLRSTKTPEIKISSSPKSERSESFCPKRRESQSSDEMRDILNFESSIMATSYMPDDEIVEAVPQVNEALGEVAKPIPMKPASFSKKLSSDTDEDYCIIAEEERAVLGNYGVKDIDVAQDPIRIVDNHFSVPIGKPDLLRAPPDFPMATSRYTLCEMTVTWHLHGGHDFPKKDESECATEESKTMHSTSGMSKVYTSGVSYTKGQPGVTFGKKPISELSSKTRGGKWRKHDVLVEVQINKVRISHEIYPTHTIQASRQVLLITEMEIRDRLQSSDINKFLYHPSANRLPKKSSQHMVVIKALHVRPNPILPAQECCLRISLLPLRLNIDQDTLLFLVDYFTELSTGGSGQTKKQVIVPHQPPVMTVDDIPEALQDLQARKMVSDNLMLLMEEEREKSPEQITDEEQDMPIYFREVIFSPEVSIRLDYHGRRIELSRGPVAGLLMGLGQLQCSEIRLKKVCYRQGLLGVDRLLNFLFKEWLQDIKKNQLPSILSGVGPMYSFVQLFQGIRDLFWLPIEQYQKDGRIVRGLQLGAQSFTARTALAALEITARIIQLLQLTAETAYDMVSPGPSVKRTRYNRKGKRKRIHRPQDIREGVANAYQIVKEGIGETAQTLFEVTAEEHDQKGYTGAVGAVVRQIPPMVFRPVVLVTQATANILDGVQIQLIPEARNEAREKWKEDEQ